MSEYRHEFSSEETLLLRSGAITNEKRINYAYASLHDGDRVYVEFADAATVVVREPGAAHDAVYQGIDIGGCSVRKKT